MKLVWPITLLVAAGVGFAVISSKTKKPSTTIGGNHYRAGIYLGEGGQWYAQVFINDKPTGAQLGPLPSEEEAAQQAADFLASMDVSAFYTLRQAANSDPSVLAPDWFFDGWSRGVMVTSGGPFANAAAAKGAAKVWQDAAMAGGPGEVVG